MKPQTTEPMVMWVIYDHPADHPTAFIARKWRIDAHGPHATTDTVISNDLDDLRFAMKGLGLVALPRWREDDPTVVETWV